jgi:broad specificity phosphatase PhoE
VNRLVLMRHGECEGGGTYAGRGSDVPLTDDGRDQIRRAGEFLMKKEIIPQVIITSSLRRAVESGRILAESLGISPSTGGRPPDYRLDETDFGLFEGLTYEEILRDYPIQSNLWFKDPWENPPPGGEATKEIFRRVEDFHKDLMTRFSRDREDLAIVAHGGSLRLLICLLLNIPPQNHWHFRLERGGQVHFQLTDDFPVMTAMVQAQAYKNRPQGPVKK